MNSILLGLAAVNVVLLFLLLLLVWKLSSGSEIQATRAELAERLARSAAETQQHIGDRVSAALSENRREQESRLSGLQQAVQGELAAGRGEVSRLLTGLLAEQRQALSGFQETVEGRLDQIRERTDQRLGEIGQRVQAKLDQNIQEGFRHFDKIQEHLRAAEEQLAGLSAVGSSITELNNLLKLPHLRGGFGEATLERLLADFLPATMFGLQVPIASSQERVDAVVKFPKHLLPIDSKFPREQVANLFEGSDPGQLAEARRTLSTVVRREARRISKYIRPDAGTTDMALMFLPSETLYFEVLRDTELWQTLRREKVFVVSPNTLGVTLQSVALAYQYYEMATNVEATLEQVKKARRHFEHFEKRFEEIGRGLEKAREAFDTAGTHLRHYSSSVARLTGEPQLSLPEDGGPSNPND